MDLGDLYLVSRSIYTNIYIYMENEKEEEIKERF